MPVGSFTTRVVVEQVSHIAGNSPVMVDVMNDREVIMELVPESVVVHTAQALQTTWVWDGRLAEITCFVALHHSVMHVIHEWEITQNWLHQLEAESQEFKHEQQMNQEQLMELLQHFSLEVKWIEELKKEVSQQKIMAATLEASPVHITPEVLEGATTMENVVDTLEKEKISKPPPIVYFSGIEPIPKEEGSHDQWEFQVRGVMDTHTENSVRAAIVNSLRGPARELVSFIGYSADINLILSEVSNRFCKKYNGDKLQKEFYQMKQDKGEKIRVFARWLEQTYRRLRERFPGRFDEDQLKDRLFHGMLQGLGDSMRFLYKDPHVNYHSLLESTEEAEDEAEESRI